MIHRALALVLLAGCGVDDYVLALTAGDTSTTGDDTTSVSITVTNLTTDPAPATPDCGPPPDGFCDWDADDDPDCELPVIPQALAESPPRHGQPAATRSMRARFTLPSLSSLAATLWLALSFAACSDASSASSTESGPDTTGSPSDETTGTEKPDVLSGPFDLSDVSILYPLPETDKLLKASTQAAYGVLLPQALFASLPGLGTGGVGTGGEPQKGEFYDDLRVVALRVDPCFPSLSLPTSSCRAQIRLSLQPVWYANGKAVDADVAVHLLYDLPPAELDEFVAQISTLKAASQVKTTGAPLTIHAALKEEGVDGAFGSGLRAAILAKIGGDRLTRIAMMGLPQDQAQWRFFGFDVENGKAMPIDIAHAGVEAQDIHVTFGPDGDVYVEQNVATDDDLGALLSVASSMPAPSATAALSAALRIENPKLRDVESVSCAACHLAGPLRERAEKHWGLSSAGAPDAFVAAGFDLTTTSEIVGDATALRAFGYRFGETVISQRVINDSAAVAAYLNARQN